MPDDGLGPLETITSANGEAVPLYALRFSKEGTCESPRTRAHLLERLATEGLTDLYFFSHGWNNEWEVALNRYRHFARGYAGLRAELGLAPTRPYRPLLVGVIWPSTSLLFAWEQGPAIAAGGDAALDVDDADALELVAGALGAGDAATLRELAARPGLDASARGRFAELLRAAAGQEGESADELVAAWAGDPADEEKDDGLGFGALGAATGGPAAAGGASWDPRQLLRLATVRMMKDRAGVVGATGVGAFLRDALGAFAGHVHLLGHSYGARVMLSAVSIAPLPRPVASMLLLQPAVNHLCFAQDAGEGAPGGYRPALARVAQPILVTHSAKDVPLRRIFHVALRRKRDLGEAQIAGTAPRFGALGGFGPGGVVSVRHQKIAAPPTPYDLTGVEVIALDGSDGAIGGHGDISNRATWWALHQLVAGA